MISFKRSYYMVILGIYECNIKTFRFFMVWKGPENLTFTPVAKIGMKLRDPDLIAINKNSFHR